MFIIIWQEIKDAFPFLFEQVHVIKVVIKVTDKFTASMAEMAKVFSLFAKAGVTCAEAMEGMASCFKLASYKYDLKFEFERIESKMSCLKEYELPEFTFEEHLEDCFGFII